MLRQAHVLECDARGGFGRGLSQRDEVLMDVRQPVFALRHHPGVAERKDVNPLTHRQHTTSN